MSLPPVQSTVNSVYIRFFTRKWSRAIIAEDLARFFASFGFVTEVSIMDFNLDQHSGRQNGVGFVHFMSTDEGMNATLRAVSMDGSTVEGVAFRVELSRNFLKQFEQDGRYAPVALQTAAVRVQPWVRAPQPPSAAAPALPQQSAASHPLDYFIELADKKKRNLPSVPMASASSLLFQPAPGLGTPAAPARERSISDVTGSSSTGSGQWSDSGPMPPLPSDLGYAGYSVWGNVR